MTDAESPAAALRFVLLRHECPADYRDGPHWDLMVERPDTDAEHRLATWSLIELPASWAGALGLADRNPAGADTVSAIRLPDHRAKYLEYEGPVSGRRGEVTRYAAGSAVWLAAEGDALELRIESDALGPGAIAIRGSADRTELAWAPNPPAMSD